MRATQLRVDEIRRLDHWCRNLHHAFPDAVMVALVGSVLERPDYRDVDIRIVLPDAVADAIPMVRLDLNMLLSRWGQEQTGLAIDCQIQSLTESQDHDGPVNPRDGFGRLPAGTVTDIDLGGLNG